MQFWSVTRAGHVIHLGSEPACRRRFLSAAAGKGSRPLVLWDAQGREVARSEAKRHIAYRMEQARPA